MEKFTVIWNKCWQSGSHWHTSTHITRFRVDSIHQVLETEAGKNAQFIFEGWPILHNELEDSQFGIQVVKLNEQKKPV